LGLIAESPLEDLVSLLPCHPFSVRSDSVACVQATHFGCGAIALAVCAAHKVVDAASLASFILTWSRISRGDLPSSSPTFDSHAIFPPQDMTCLDSDCTPKQNPAEPLVTHVFVFEPQTIKSLKASCMVLGIVPTTVEAVSILIWRSISKDGQPSGLAHVINIRQALEPPLPEGSFGNVVLGTFAEDRSGSGGNEEMVRAAIRSVDKEYVKKVRGRPMGLVESMARMMELWRDEGTAFVGLTSWYRFPIYGNDLGWGRPVWASPGGACMPGVVKLMPTRDTGGVEMWVTLPRQDMDLFERCPQISAYCSRRF
ncbi:BAHD acyltransferase At5g47980, partial [Amborella trichopoda]|uniref:BAHD acyltransferase At5g47980 n=1 Tax=Amborella trichopoda TaxID=13333 RepID=UPI0009C1181C